MTPGPATWPIGDGRGDSSGRPSLPHDPTQMSNPPQTDPTTVHHSFTVMKKTELVLIIPQAEDWVSKQTSKGVPRHGDHAHPRTIRTRDLVARAHPPAYPRPARIPFGADAESLATAEYRRQLAELRAMRELFAEPDAPPRPPAPTTVRPAQGATAMHRLQRTLGVSHSPLGGWAGSATTMKPC